MYEAFSNALSKIKVIHTLGPAGTNCERAALEWFGRRNVKGEVVLYDTLESAVENIATDSTHALLGCVVYPMLHTLVFSNLKKMVLADCFVMPTFNMLLASRNGLMPKVVSSHPAPEELVPSECEVRHVNSNVQAAIACANGETDGCITTLPAATMYKLKSVVDYGPVHMGFTIHLNRQVLDS